MLGFLFVAERWLKVLRVLRGLIYWGERWIVKSEGKIFACRRNVVCYNLERFVSIKIFKWRHGYGEK